MIFFRWVLSFGLCLPALAAPVSTDTDLTCQVKERGTVLEPRQMASSINGEGDRAISGSSDLFAFDLSLNAERARVELWDKRREARGVLRTVLRKGDALELELFCSGSSG